MLFLQRKESSPLFRRIRKDSSTQPVSAFVCVGVVGGDEKGDEAVHVSSRYRGGCGRVCTGFKIYQKNKQRKVFSENVAKVPTQDQRMSTQRPPVHFRQPV